MCGRDHPQGRVDRGHRVGIHPGIKEALRPAQDRQRRIDSTWHRRRLRTHAQKCQQFELRLVIERSPTSQIGQAPLDAAGQSGQRLATQQRSKALKVGVNGENVDALGAQESRQRGDGWVRRRGITRRGKDEGKFHGVAQRGRRSFGQNGIVGAEISSVLPWRPQDATSGHGWMW